MDAEIIDLADEDNSGGRVNKKKKDIKVGATHLPRTRNVIGTPEINATNFLFDDTRTPMCHSL